MSTRETSRSNARPIGIALLTLLLAGCSCHHSPSPPSTSYPSMRDDEQALADFAQHAVEVLGESSPSPPVPWCHDPDRWVPEIKCIPVTDRKRSDTKMTNGQPGTIRAEARCTGEFHLERCVGWQASGNTGGQDPLLRQQPDYARKVYARNACICEGEHQGSGLWASGHWIECEVTARCCRVVRWECQHGD